MSETTVKTLKDAPAAFRALVREDVRVGDTRETTRFIKKGHRFDFKDHERKYIAECDMLIEVEEVYRFDENSYYWETMTWHWGTARRAPTWKQRLRAWLMYPVVPSDLPQARLLEEKKK